MSIEVSNIRKRFGSFVALDDVSISIPTGELVALLGQQAKELGPVFAALVRRQAVRDDAELRLGALETGGGAVVVRGVASPPDVIDETHLGDSCSSGTHRIP